MEDAINLSINAHINFLEQKRQYLLAQTKEMTQQKNDARKFTFEIIH